MTIRMRSDLIKVCGACGSASRDERGNTLVASPLYLRRKKYGILTVTVTRFEGRSMMRLILWLNRLDKSAPGFEGPLTWALTNAALLALIEITGVVLENRLDTAARFASSAKCFLQSQVASDWLRAGGRARQGRGRICKRSRLSTQHCCPRRRSIVLLPFWQKSSAGQSLTGQYRSIPPFFLPSVIVD